MDEKMKITEETKLTELLEHYPWMAEEAIRLDERFRIVNSPMGRLLLRNTTIADLGKKAGLPPQEIMDKIGEMIAQKEQEGAQ